MRPEKVRESEETNRKRQGGTNMKHFTYFILVRGLTSVREGA